MKQRESRVEGKHGGCSSFTWGQRRLLVLVRWVGLASKKVAFGEDYESHMQAERAHCSLLGLGMSGGVSR